MEQQKLIQKNEKQKTALEKTLRNKIWDQKRQLKNRRKRKEMFSKMLAAYPESASILKTHNRVGRPRVEESQPELLKAIVDIATYGAGAHERRRSDIYRCVKSLDELCGQLQKEGFQIKRGALYIRLLPRRSDTNEGKRHVVTVPVKLLKVHNDSHESHVDGRFCTASIRSVEELSSFLGLKEVFFMSNDDKARVSIGLTAAKLQAPMIMHVEYKVTLPDHDWVVAGKHKLIPSEYAGVVIKPNGLGKPEAVGHSGPTYIAIRSGKNSKSFRVISC